MEEPTPDDLADLTETIQGRPLIEPAGTALARMQRQHALLTADLAELNALHPGREDSQYAKQLREDLREITLRIAEYQHQLGNQN